MDSRSVKRTLIVADILFGIALPFTIMPAIFSGMLSDGGSGVTVYIAVFSLLAFPFVLTISILVPWIFYRLGMLRTALLILSLPVLNFLPVFLLVLLPEMGQ